MLYLDYLKDKLILDLVINTFHKEILHQFLKTFMLTQEA